jgi:enamine deaminase RidA (YjgF/YER057c/UK114 family)
METQVFEEQVSKAFDKVKAALEKAGSSMEKITKTFMLLQNLDNYPRMRKAEVEYYEKHAPYLVDKPPVSTFMTLSNLTHPEALFEVDVTALT